MYNRSGDISGYWIYTNKSMIAKMKYLLISKHYQVFLLVYGLPFLNPFLSGLLPEGQVIGYLAVISMMVSMLALVSWLYSVCFGLPDQISSADKILFVIAMIYFCGYFTLNFVALYLDSNSLVVYPALHILAFLAFLLMVFYSARQISSQTKENFVSVFILILVLFIGIWILQPKLNKLAE